MDTETGTPVGRHTIEGGLTAIRAFVFGGNAIVTLQNEESGKRFTYRFRKAKRPDREGRFPYYLDLLTGSDNESNYSPLARVYLEPNGAPVYERSWSSPIAEDAPSAKGARWFVARLRDNVLYPVVKVALPAPFKVYHEGRCGKCGRLLTVPESVTSGLGPICARR